MAIWKQPAGIAGLIKVVLSLQHKKIPPHLHLKQLNPYIKIENTPIQIPTQLQAWQTAEDPRFAGVSSFGFGGTNAHVVLEEAPTQIKIHQLKGKSAEFSERSHHILTLSAKCEKALQEIVQAYYQFLGDNSTAAIADICFTANTGRSHFNHRLAITISNQQELADKLAKISAGEAPSGVFSGKSSNHKSPKIAFLFTGQGSQYVNMGRQLYETQPTFQKTLQRCDQLLKPYLDESLLEILYNPEKYDLLDQTAYTQPVLFALEYALAELWCSWGIRPDAVIGHSLGEYVAACIAGVFSLEDGLHLIAERSQLMQSLPQNGGMAVVFAEQERVENILIKYEGQVAIAAINGPNNIVISGLSEYVQLAVDQCEFQGITVKPLQVSHAFHSLLMTPILEKFESKAAKVKFKSPQITLISNLTGQIFNPKEIPDASYWCRHLRKPVQFARGMNALGERGYQIFLEIGPHHSLLSMGKRCLTNPQNIWLPSLLNSQNDWLVILNSLGVLETQGLNIDWVGFDRDYQRYKISLPNYPFQRKRYWWESQKGTNINPMNLKNLDIQEQSDTTLKTTYKTQILSELSNIVAKILQVSSSEIDIFASFLEMGADSIVLVEAVRTIEHTFDIKMTIRQMFEELTNIDSLASYIVQNQPIQTIQEKVPEPTIASETLPHLPQPALPTLTEQFTSVSENGSANKTSVVEIGLEQIMVQQLQLTSQTISQQLQLTSQVISQQLQLTSQVISQQFQSLQDHSVVSAVSSISESQVALTRSAVNNSVNGNESFAQPQSTNSPIQKISTKKEAPLESQTTSSHGHLNLGKTTPGGVEGLNPQQHQHLEALIARYTQRTQESKRAKQTYHNVLSDSRSSAGFRPSIKEMIYPIVCSRSQGSRFWDVDGNEYVDITMGFGVHLFGHNPAFILEALQEQIKLGIQLGPQPRLAGEVAKLFCELTGNERVTFCQSGTEAVMTSLRLARTATGRTKIVLFSGSYHGHFDGVLARGQPSENKLLSVPIAPGISPQMVEDIVVLNYGEPQALEYIEAHAHELAAVLVEPVQSRRPDLQPKEFLQHLRQITAKSCTALIFDEIITGFRIHPGGAQAHFGVKPDLATYGKILGGGLPFAAVAGQATLLNGIDGGQWNYGDDSYPSAEKTFFAGTFNKHPLALANARAVLKHLQNQGVSLQEQLNQRTAQLAKTLNAFFEQEYAPIEVVYFGSLFRFSFKKNLDLLFYHLVEKGVYIWEGRTCFLSTAHTDEDIQYVIQSVKKSVAEMQVGGFLPKSSANSNAEARNSTNLSLAKSSTSELCILCF